MKTENTVEKRMHSWIPVLQRKDVKARITLQTYSYFRYFHLLTRCNWKILSGIVVYLNFDVYIAINLILPKQMRGNASTPQSTRLSRFYCQYRPTPLSTNRSTVNTQNSIPYDYCPRNYAIKSIILTTVASSLSLVFSTGVFLTKTFFFFFLYFGPREGEVGWRSSAKLETPLLSCVSLLITRSVDDSWGRCLTLYSRGSSLIFILTFFRLLPLNVKTSCFKLKPF